MAHTPDKVRTLTVDCPTCDGDGEIESFEDIADQWFGHSTRAVMIECDECDGEGTIEICAVCVERSATPAGDDLAHGYVVTP